MGKTPAERQRDRRARLAADPILYQEYLKKERERKKEKRKTMKKSELKELRRRTKLHTRLWRLQKVKRPTSKGVITQTHHDGANEKAYKSPATLVKASRRVEKSLPKSPRKKKAVVAHVASKVLGSTNIKEKRIQRTRISDDMLKKIELFYNRDDVSRVSPGKADTISIKENGTRVHKQKRHLMMTLDEAFALFNLDNPECNIGRSTFCSLRPKEVLLAQDMPHNVCVCITHENIILLLESLHRKTCIIPLYSQDFLEIYVCDPTSEKCMASDCSTCQEGKLFNQHIADNIENTSDNIKWFQWSKNETGYLEKQSNTSTIEEAIRKLVNNMPKFLWHVFIKRQQSKAYEEDKEKAKKTESQIAVVQMDFSENYTCVYQDECASAHWNQSQAEILYYCL